MYIMGITGPIGAGKSVALQAMKKAGALPLDCDEIYHELLAANPIMTDEIIARFPEAVSDSIVDRKKLGKIVFNDTDALRDLNSITHKYVFEEVERRISGYENQGGRAAVVCAIELIGSYFAKNCNSILCITAPADIRLSRIMQRDGLSRDEALARIKAQQNDEHFISGSDYVLENSFDNTAGFEEACVNTMEIDRWFAGREDDIISDLGELVAINSVRGKTKPGAPFGEEPRRALRKMQELLEKHGFDVSVFDDMVISSQLGHEPMKLGILTHLDIVEAGEGWDTDPFKLIIKDGRCFGRGVMDNKGPSIAAMYAAKCVRELIPELKNGVRLIFGSSEETGFDDISQYMRINDMPPNVFSPDSEFPVVNVEKGRFMPSFCASWKKDTALPRIISITGGKTSNIVPNHAVAVIEGISRQETVDFCKKFSEKTGTDISAGDVKDLDAAGKKASEDSLIIIAKGEAAHASRPHMGNNAQTALIEMLAAMPFAKSPGFEYICKLARLFPHGDYYGNAFGLAMQDDISGKTTVSFGVLRFNEHELSGNFDARTAICADESDVLELTRKVFEREGFKIENHEIKPGHHTPAETPFVRTLLRVYKEHTGKQGECISMGGLTYVHDVPGGVAFGCNMPGQDNNIHAPNEFIDISHLTMCTRMFAQVIAEMCGRNDI